MRFDLLNNLFEIVVEIIDRVFLDLPCALTQSFPIGDGSDRIAPTLDEGGRGRLEGPLQNRVLQRVVRASSLSSLTIRVV